MISARLGGWRNACGNAPAQARQSKRTGNSDLSLARAMSGIDNMDDGVLKPANVSGRLHINRDRDGLIRFSLRGDLRTQVARHTKSEMCQQPTHVLQEGRGDPTAQHSCNSNFRLDLSFTRPSGLSGSGSIGSSRGGGRSGRHAKWRFQ